MKQLSLVPSGFVSALCLLLALPLVSGCDVSAEDGEPPAAAEVEDESAVAVATDELSFSDVAHFLNGRRLFFQEKFDGNGRACGTCHLGKSIHDNLDLAPADVQAAYATDPTGPLFRAIDSDDGESDDFALLLRDATVRIPFTLPANVTVDELDSPNVQVNADGTVTVFVRRGVPTIKNAAFEDNLMADGRFGADLEAQAVSAVASHYEPESLPSAGEAADMAFFEEQVFSSIGLGLYANGFSPPSLPPGRTKSERRGREFFVSSGPIDATHRGLCATCHSGPLLNTTDAFNPIQPPDQRISNNFVSETNMMLGNQNEELTYHVTLQHDVAAPGGPVLIPTGTVLTLESSDPGRLLVTGDPCEAPAACLINPGSTVSLFKIPTLWGTARSAPYFHDNSAASFEEVLDVYQFLFAVTAQGIGNPAFVITPQDREDIIAYMSFAFR